MRLEQQLLRARQSFESGITKDVGYRKKQLRNLKRGLLELEDEILLALNKDLNKSPNEGFLTELGMVYSELEDSLKNLSRWAKPTLVRPTLSQLPSIGKLIPEPYGVVLVLAPWNYPFQLSICPVIGALAAGNAVVLKPSRQAPETGKIIKKLVETYLDPCSYQVVLDEDANEKLLEERFDYIFYTGSSKTGKRILEKAAKNLTPVSLELGGKSPCVVDKGLDLKKVAKRILFGKLLNAGQTCVAPDYLLVHEQAYEGLLEALKETYVEMLGDKEYLVKHTPTIVNEKQYQRLIELTQGEEIIFQDTRVSEGHFPFTLIKSEGRISRLMEEEIFGPVLPIITLKNTEDAISFIREGEKPLAFYLFTKDQRLKKRMLRDVSFGGGTINDTVLHLSNPRMPFGGVGYSGMGSYHGKKSFETFSHYKSVLFKGFIGDIPLRYHPVKDPKKKVPKFLLTK